MANKSILSLWLSKAEISPRILKDPSRHYEVAALRKLTLAWEHTVTAEVSAGGVRESYVQSAWSQLVAADIAMGKAGLR